MADMMTSMAVHLVRPTWDALGGAACLPQTQVRFYIFSCQDGVDDDDDDVDDDDNRFCLLPANT